MKQSKDYSEPYDQRKLRASLYAACLGVGMPAGAAELIADRVCRDISPWLATKQEITSGDVRRKAAAALHPYNPHASYLYKHYRLTA